VKRERVILSDIGKAVEETWREIPGHYQNVSGDEYVIVPNHIHGNVIIISAEVGAPS
jgi:REP element-mobilizing transposase RayT